MRLTLPTGVRDWTAKLDSDEDCRGGGDLDLELEMCETKSKSESAVPRVGCPTVGQGLRQQDRQMRRRYDVSPGGLQCDIIWPVLGIRIGIGRRIISKQERRPRNWKQSGAGFPFGCLPLSEMVAYRRDIWLAVSWVSGSSSMAALVRQTVAVPTRSQPLRDRHHHHHHHQHHQHHRRMLSAARNGTCIRCAALPEIRLLQCPSPSPLDSRIPSVSCLGFGRQGSAPETGCMSWVFVPNAAARLGDGGDSR